MALQREAVTWAPVNFKGKCNSQTFPKSKQTLCHILHFITEEIFSFLCRSHSRSDSTHSCMWMYSTSRGTYSTKTIGIVLYGISQKLLSLTECLDVWRHGSLRWHNHLFCIQRVDPCSDPMSSESLLLIDSVPPLPVCDVLPTSLPLSDWSNDREVSQPTETPFTPEFPSLTAPNAAASTQLNKEHDNKPNSK